MFNPFRPGQAGQAPGTPTPDQRAGAAARATRPNLPTEAAIDDLKRKLDELQNQLAELSKKP